MEMDYNLKIWAKLFKLLPNLVPRVSPLPAPWNESFQGAGRGETLGTRLVVISMAAVCFLSGFN